MGGRPRRDLIGGECLYPGCGGHSRPNMSLWQSFTDH